MKKRVFASALAVMTAISSLTVDVKSAEHRNTVYISTKAISDGAAEYAQDMFSEMPVSDLTYLGLSSADAKSAVISDGFIAENLEGNSEDFEVIYYPVVSDGKISAMMIVTYYNGKYGYQLGKDTMADNLGNLETSYDSPAKIYVSDNAFYAATSEGVVILSYGLECNTKSIKEETVKVETLYKERASQGETVVAYGSADGKLTKIKGKTYLMDDDGEYAVGWQTVGGNKYYFKKDGSAVTKNTTIDGKRYKFASDGKYLGTFTGWSKSNENKYYYKKGVLQTGWITVKDKKYYAAKNGLIRTGWVAVNGDIYYFDGNGIWDGKTYKSYNHVYKPKTVGDFLLDFDYPTDALYEINFNDGKYISFDNIELIREILENESKTKLIYDDILSDDEVQEGLDYPDRNAIMIRSTPKQDEDKKMPHLKFSKDSSGNVYLYCPFYNFGCILEDNSVYDKLISEIPSTDRKPEITDELETY